MTCDFYSCEKPRRDEDVYITEGLQFCKDHGAQCDKIISRLEEEDSAIRELLGFWVKAHGGAKRFAGFT